MHLTTHPIFCVTIFIRPRALQRLPLIKNICLVLPNFFAFILINIFVVDRVKFPFGGGGWWIYAYFYIYAYLKRGKKYFVVHVGIFTRRKYI